MNEEMKKIRDGRYTYFIIPNKKVICISSYAGKKVKGTASCDPSDNFNEEFGMALAKTRCDQKVAIKRHNRALDKCSYFEALVDYAEFNLENAVDYERESYAEAIEAINAENRLLGYPEITDDEVIDETED